jgi:hypothetical protein
MSPGKARRRILASLTVVVAALFLSVSAAEAATVTVGSPLTAYPNGGFVGNNGSAVTVANLALPEPGANVSSPVAGTVVQWRVMPAGTGQYAIRVLRPNGSGGYTGVGTAAQTISSPGSYTFPASLPIQAGDVIGLDIPNNQGMQGANLEGASWSFWVPPVPDGSPATPIDNFTNAELFFNADVQYPDPPTVKKKCKKKKHKRSASSAKKKCKKKKKK